ncbi:hypothetical protein GCM10023172_27490 [Hymenobacter ginsengisoli]|uniref:Phage tail tape measure protein n=1 Tax=Hymenobacter ginsengisoli TaxID=1051626 RepID=A0ABP8QJ87_9BACT|nr:MULTISPECIES: hypothetical protein [unclassified Hymenobacter]MBO2029996.1 hypothetical protein [Hymenobacter sp. BT559]
MSALTIPVKFSLEDLVSPGLAKIIRQTQEITQKIERPHHLNVDTSAAKSGLQGIGKLLGGLGLAFGAFEAFNFLKESVSMFNSADQAGAQFDATLRSTGNAVGIARGELLKMSTDLMGKSLFDDDAITGAQSILLTFHNIKGAVYKEAVPAMLDMATKMHLSLDSAAQLVGKALDSPKEGLSALTRMGVRFSDSQQAMIAKFVKTGQAAKAQSLMLQELKVQFGGSAEAASKAGTGGWTVLYNRFNNVRESIGALLSQGADQGLPILNNLVTEGQKAVDWVSTHLEGIKAAFAPLQDAVQPLLDTFRKLWGEQYGNSEVGDILAQTFNRIGGVIRLVSPFIKTAATLLGAVWEQGQRVVNTLAKFWETTPKLQKFFSGLYEGALSAFKGIAEAVGKYLGGTATFIEGIFTGDLHKIGDGLKQTLGSLGDLQGVGMKAANSFVDGYKKGVGPTDDLLEIGLFGVESKGRGDAASKFMAGGKSASKALVPALTADASKGGVVGGSSGGAKVINITLRVDSPFRNTIINVNGVTEGAKEAADTFREWFMAELNDVNTMSSNF